MTHSTQRILRSQFLSLVLTSLGLIALLGTPASAQWTTNGNNINNSNTGNVAIGTSLPYAQFHLQGVTYDDGSIKAQQIVASTVPYNSGPVSGITFWNKYNAAGHFAGLGGITAAKENTTDGNYSAYLALHTRTHGASPAERLRIDSNGRVGINTTTPQFRLDVNGDTNVSGNVTVSGTGNITAVGTIEAGNIKAKFQDVAEWVPASEQIPAGTVVVLDSTKSNHVISSNTAYDTRVAGVISAQPGIALGESGDSKVLVATSGRVRIKVDATSSPIQVGDLLVTSDNAGMAMKSQPLSLGGVQIHRPGTLIGKALEPLAKGKGEILVLLSLQ